MTAAVVSLRDLVRAELEVAATPVDFADIARRVLRQIPDPAVALAEVMPLVIGDVIRAGRRPIPAPADFPPPSAPAPAGASSGAAGRARRVSARVAALRADLEQMYRTETGQKRLGEMTADDLAYVSAGLRALAASSTAKADQLDELHAEMLRRGVPTVADLLP